MADDIDEVLARAHKWRDIKIVRDLAAKLRTEHELKQIAQRNVVLLGDQLSADQAKNETACAVIRRHLRLVRAAESVMTWWENQVDASEGDEAMERLWAALDDVKSVPNTEQVLLASIEGASREPAGQPTEDR